VGQVYTQLFVRMKDLDKKIVIGDPSSDRYEAWFENDSKAVTRYIQAQHN